MRRLQEVDTVRDWHLHVVTGFAEGCGCSAVAGAGPRGPYWLDICLDFFACNNPFEVRLSPPAVGDVVGGGGRDRGRQRGIWRNRCLLLT